MSTPSRTNVITRPLPRQVTALLVVGQNGRCLCVDPGQEVTEEIKRWAEGLNQKGAYTLFRDQAKEGATTPKVTAL